MNLLEFPYPSRRIPTVAQHGIVATAQPLAARAGLAMLEAGGNAVDAAIAAAIMLTVVEPTSNGIGSDAFALVWDGTKLHGLNGSGRAPAALTREHLAKLGHTTMPIYGWLPITVPGAPRAWHDLHTRWGKLPFEKLFEPAIRTAEEGHALPPVIAHYWQRGARTYAPYTSPEFRGWNETFAPDGRAPQVGETWRSPEMAESLRQIAQTDTSAFYTGVLAEKIAAFARETGGLITEADLAAHTGSWVEPIQATYRDHEIWEIPPNGQGLAALIALNILEEFDLRALGRESVEAYHLQIEAMKLAFSDAFRYIADPDHAEVPLQWLLSKEYATERRSLITKRAQFPKPGEPTRGGTVYLCAADSSGMMVSFIQSNYTGFGSGVVVPGTGISLQNRGAGFTLEPDHPNTLAPGKRPFHTIIPAFLTKGGQAVGPFGVMGGFMQPQGHVQMVLNTVDWNLNPQASLDAPRWQLHQGLEILMLEYGVPQFVVEGLAARGHNIQLVAEVGTFGRGQIIWRMESGALVGGSEPRADGLALGY